VRTIRPRLTLVLLSRWFNWRAALLIVKPTTLVAWHRKGFRLFWRRKSEAGRRPILVELQHLIDKIADENPSWARSGLPMSCC
jgi:putative transposase